MVSALSAVINHLIFRLFHFLVTFALCILHFAFFTVVKVNPTLLLPSHTLLSFWDRRTQRKRYSAMFRESNHLFLLVSLHLNRAQQPGDANAHCRLFYRANTLCLSGLAHSEALRCHFSAPLRSRLL